MPEILNEFLIGILANIIVCSVVFGTAALLGWLLGGGGVRRNAITGVTILRYGNFFRGLGTFCMLSFGALGIMSVIFAPDLRWGYALFWGCWFFLGVWWVTEAFQKEVRLDDSGITARSLFGRLTIIAWHEVEAISYWGGLGYFRVRGLGKSIWLSHWLEGLDDFKNACRRRLAPELYGAALDKPLNRHLHVG